MNRNATAMDGQQIYRVVIADDYPLLRQVLTVVVESDARFKVVGVASNPDDALSIIEQLSPDLALLDLRYDHADRFDLIKSVAKSCPDTAIVVLSERTPIECEKRCLDNGASGFLNKAAHPTEIVNLMARILTQSPKTGLRNIRITDKTPFHDLSPNEYRVFQLIGAGFSNSQIAKALFRSEKTIETYRSRIKRKMGLASNESLIRYAIGHAL